MHGFPASLLLSTRIRPDKNVDLSIKWKAELDSYWYFAELWQSGISLPVYCNSVNREFPKKEKWNVVDTTNLCTTSTWLHKQLHTIALGTQRLPVGVKFSLLLNAQVRIIHQLLFLC